jgi:hypothetical protein
MSSEESLNLRGGFSASRENDVGDRWKVRFQGAELFHRQAAGAAVVAVDAPAADADAN